MFIFVLSCFCPADLSDYMGYHKLPVNIANRKTNILCNATKSKNETFSRKILAENRLTNNFPCYILGFGKLKPYPHRQCGRSHNRGVSAHKFRRTGFRSRYCL